jgi:hypothetical protein
MTNLPRHTKLILALLAFLPAYFAIAALGTKIGIWDWKFGLGTLTFSGGLIVFALVALAALVSLVLALRAAPRRAALVVVAILGLLAPATGFAMFVMARGTAAENPVSDIATDTGNPPAFSAGTLAARAAEGANPVNDYQTPLGEIEPYKARVTPELKVKSLAQIITAMHDRPAPLPLAGATREQGVAAVAAAMGAMGFKDIRPDPVAGTIEGVAESFWFGFKDDVVARVGGAQIDFRSVSRVGVSDLGANAARIADLRARTEVLLGTAAR